MSNGANMADVAAIHCFLSQHACTGPQFKDPSAAEFNTVNTHLTKECFQSEARHGNSLFNTLIVDQKLAVTLSMPRGYHGQLDCSTEYRSKYYSRLLTLKCLLATQISQDRTVMILLIVLH